MNQQMVIDELKKMIEETKLEIINMEEELNKLSSIDN